MWEGKGQQFEKCSHSYQVKGKGLKCTDDYSMMI